jgi:hypothetical protein
MFGDEGKIKVLFLCAGNSCRSQIAEGWARHLKGNIIDAYSAGIRPIDVHMGRLCKILGFYNKKSVSLRTAVQITQGFAEIESADPVKYDFALSRVGIVENCNGRYHNDCEFCELFKFCRQR